MFYNTVTPLLQNTLEKLMHVELLKPFRLVGGTSLSLQLGHRESVDIDLFTDLAYNTVDLKAIEEYLVLNFPYISTSNIDLVGFGKSFYIGDSELDYVKSDLYYTDPFIRPVKEIDGIHLPDIEDVIAMKLDIVSRNERKKYFWDLHEYSVDCMLDFYFERYPYGESKHQIVKNLTEFEYASNDADLNCLRGKYWDLIKLDFIELLEP